MKSSQIIANVLRFLGLLFLQVLVLKRLPLGLGTETYLHIILYPLFILLLPIGTPQPLVLLLAFLMGLGVDVFYDSLGIHAAAAVITAFARPLVLALLEPREGYNVDQIPGRRTFGLNWFLQYSCLLLAVHLFSYFSIEAFTFYYILRILLKTLVSFFFSMIFVLLFSYLFKSD